MKETKWRAIIISNLIGVAFGILLISIGFKYISENIRLTIITTVILILITGIFTIIVYRNRRKILSSILGVNKEKIGTVSKDLVDSIKENDSKKLQNAIDSISNIFINYISEMSFRVWAFRIFFGLFAIFGGIITAGLLLRQNELIEVEKTYSNSKIN